MCQISLHARLFGTLSNKKTSTNKTIFFSGLEGDLEGQKAKIVTFNIWLIEESIWFSMTCLKNVSERNSISRICSGLKLSHKLFISLSIRLRIRAQLFSYSLKMANFHLFFGYMRSVQKKR